MDSAQKHYTVKSQTLADRTIRFIGSDESIDRDGDTIALDGWDIKNYMANPVALYGHNSLGFPVGKTQSITIDKRSGKMFFDISFPTIEELSSNPKTPSEQALTVDAIYCMAKAGLLNAVSVGFRGLEYEPIATGRAYKKQELIEISIVPVPANPNALAVLRSANTQETVIKGLNMDIQEKSGARLSAKSKERLARIRAKCNDVMKELDDFENEPNVNEEEQGAQTAPSNNIPPEKSAEAPQAKAYFTFVEKNSTDK